MGDRGQFTGGIDGAGVDVAGLATHDGRPSGVGCKHTLEIDRQHRAVGVDGNPLDRLRAESQEPCRAGNRDMYLFADDETDGRRAGQPVGLDIPACCCEHVMTSGGERGGVGHLAAGDEREGRFGRQAQQVDHPTTGDLLDHRGRRAGREQTGVLVPRCHQPVGSKCRRHRAPDHESEEPAGAHPHQPAGFDRVGHAMHHGRGIGGALRSRPTQCLAQLCRRGRRGDAGVAQAGAVCDAAFGD